MLEEKLKIGQIVYLTSQTSPTKISYIKEIDDDNILLDNELRIKAKTINDINKVGLLTIKFK
jgi:hypothetical protein